MRLVLDRGVPQQERHNAALGGLTERDAEVSMVPSYAGAFWRKIIPLQAGCLGDKTSDKTRDKILGCEILGCETLGCPISPVSAGRSLQSRGLGTNSSIQAKLKQYRRQKDGGLTQVYGRLLGGRTVKPE
jgi:hypothetical protein